MAQLAVNHLPAKAWLTEFLFTRVLFTGPTGQPLYSYHVTEDEYTGLAAMLKMALTANSPTQELYVAACFCLFVSENYRRHYDGNWSWQGAESRIGITLTPAQHASLTGKGLGYWKRKVRIRDQGRDWLGTLFTEGGLPWPLLSSESHGFGRAVRRGIKHFYRTEGHRRTTADLLADFEDGLPLSFRNLETRTLLAGIVDQLMTLVDRYPIKDEVDPAAYLDRVDPHWHEAFPIPLDETNARHLLNEWLRDAGIKRQERKEALAKARAFNCEHIQQGQLPHWTILTELNLPPETLLPIDPSSLRNTRFELAYFEGETLLERGPAVYAQLAEKAVKIRFANVQVSLRRRYLNKPVSLRVMESGSTIHTFLFENSALDYQDVPLVFEYRADRWHLVGTSSCKLASSKVRVRVPERFTFSDALESTVPVLTDVESGQWIETTGNLILKDDAERYEICLSQPGGDVAPLMLTGVYALFECSPSTVYLGWPTLELAEGSTWRRDELIEFANGRPLDRRNALVFGAINYIVRSRKGETLLRRRFGVLPRGFELGLYPAYGRRPARLQVKNADNLSLHVAGEGLLCSASQGSYLMELSGQHCPQAFTLQIGPAAGLLHLRLPFPYQGARLLGVDGQHTAVKTLNLAELTGHRLQLSSGLPQGQMFYLQFELMCREQSHPKRVFAVRVGQMPMVLNLFSYVADLQTMLAAVDEQDAYVHLTVETEQLLMQLDIRRYGGRVLMEEASAFYVCGVDGTDILDDARAEAMLLSDPKQAPLQLIENTTEGVGAGRFAIPQSMLIDGPWLIYPGKESPIQFRPQLYLPASMSVPVDLQVRSLHRAAQVFHPIHRPDVIEEQIRAMANDFAHSGWQYLADLKRQYAHLPLSSFEAWKALAKNPQALGLAVFRLEMDEAFCARIADELALMWETIPLPMWASAYQIFAEGLKLTGLPSEHVERLVKDRAIVLRYIVSGFDYVGNYLGTGDFCELRRLSAEDILPMWYQDLRRLHAANLDWPNVLGEALAHWVAEQPLPLRVKAMSLAEFTDAVTYLPIFMAYVTAGKASVNDLGIPTAYFKFAARWLADFDRHGWFNPVHALTVSYLLAAHTDR